jgi:hypothetical protein
VVGGKRTTAVAFFGTAQGGGLAKKENEANESRGADVFLVVLVIVQVEDSDVVERQEGGVGDNNDYDNNDWTNGREGERRQLCRVRR